MYVGPIIHHQPSHSEYGYIVVIQNLSWLTVVSVSDHTGERLGKRKFVVVKRLVRSTHL